MVTEYAVITGEMPIDGRFTLDDARRFVQTLQGHDSCVLAREIEVEKDRYIVAAAWDQVSGITFIEYGGTGQFYPDFGQGYRCQVLREYRYGMRQLKREDPEYWGDLPYQGD